MKLALQLAAVAIGTGVLFFGSGWLLARGLRLDGVKAHLLAMVVRLFLTLLLAIGLLLSRHEHRVALVFTVGAAYFAAALVDGARQFRKREAKG